MHGVTGRLKRHSRKWAYGLSRRHGIFKIALVGRNEVAMELGLIDLGGGHRKKAHLAAYRAIGPVVLNGKPLALTL
jgi:hypothetical protein